MVSAYDLPLVSIFADWVSSPNADRARPAMLAAAVNNFTAAIWALKAARVPLDPRFDPGRNGSATPVG